MMKLAEILSRHKNEWILIEYSKLDAEMNVEEGRVLAHSPRKEDIFSILPRFKGKNFTMEYAGDFPKDLAVMF